MIKGFDGVGRAYGDRLDAAVAMDARILAFAAARPLAVILRLKMVVGRSNLVAEAEGGFSRIDPIGPCAGQEAQDETCDEFSHDVSFRCSRSNIRGNYGPSCLMKRYRRSADSAISERLPVIDREQRTGDETSVIGRQQQ